MVLCKSAAYRLTAFILISGVGFMDVCAAQEKQGEKPAPKPEKKESNPPSKANEGASAATKDGGGEMLALTGIEFTVPKGWAKEKVEQNGIMSPEAIFKLPKAEGDVDDGTIRITYFPMMKGKDEMNIERWIGQVTKPDGKSYTKEEAKPAKTEMGNVRLTVIDLTGNVKMTGWPEAKPNHRMIAAIVDHPKGPHYVVAGGPVKTMDKWAKDFDAFLKSAKVK